MFKSGNCVFDVVFLSSVDWDFHWTRMHQLASRLALSRTVIYMEPFGLRCIRLSDLPRLVRRVTRWFGKGDTTRLRHEPVSPSLHVHNAWYIPFPQVNWVCQVNKVLAVWQIRKLLNRYNLKQPVLFVSAPSSAAVALADCNDFSLVVFDYVDEYARLVPGNAQRITVDETALLTKSDLVIAVSRGLYNRLNQANRHTFLVPNACEPEHFRRAVNVGLQLPEDLSSIQRPIIGYVGGIADWFDDDLVRFIAFQHPDWSIVLIGPCYLSSPRSVQPGNVNYLGRKPYSQLPDYIKSFDACLIPFRTEGIGATVLPVKMFEYLAAGKPIVSTNLPEVRPYGDVVCVAATHVDFVRGIEHALLTQDDREKISKRLAVAELNSWNARVNTITELICESLNNK